MTIRHGEWFLGLLQIESDRLVCDSCGTAEVLWLAVESKVWHVATRTVRRANGELLTQANHLCDDCTSRSVEIDGIQSWYRVEAL